MQLDIYGDALGRAAQAENDVSAYLLVHAAGQDLVDEYENAVYIPAAHCLYDRHGLRVTNSMLWRDRAHKDHETWPGTSPQWRDVSAALPEIDGPVLYLGVIFPHYGHFLLEGIARLWADAMLRQPALKLMFSASHKNALAEGYVREFLDALGIPSERVVAFSQPMRLRRVYVPHPSFVIPAEAYPNHVDLPRQVAERILGTRQPVPSDVPAYLSRSRFTPGLMANSRRVPDEPRLEAALRDLGVAIYYPEHLTLAEQVRMINGHRWVIGTRGSAFHSLLFSLLGSQQHSCVLYEAEGPRVLFSYALVDAISGVNGHYVGAMARDAASGASRDDWQIDVDLTLAWLAERDVVPKTQATRSALDRIVMSRADASILGHIAGTGDVIGTADLRVGGRGSGRAIEGLQINFKGLPHGGLQYKVLSGGTWTDWTPAGQFVGTRGKAEPLTGFAARLIGGLETRYDCIYRGRFAGRDSDVSGSNGEQIAQAGALEMLELEIAGRK